MKRLIYILIYSLLFAVFINNSAQIPNNTWRDHLPYSNVKRIAEVEQKIYCATSGGMFYYNKADNSLQKYSKVNGLADVNISTIGFSENTKTLIVCYENGNIDLIADDSITNLPDIKRKIIAGEKIINNIEEISMQALSKGTHLSEMHGGEINPTEVIATLINQGESFKDGILMFIN